MDIEKKIEKWCMDEKFLNYANNRMNEEICHVPENHVLTSQCDKLMEHFEWDDRYAAPLATYLTYRLQVGKLQRNTRKRHREIWWVFVQVAVQGFYINVFADEFGPLVEELRKTIMPLLHSEYVQKMNEKKQ